MTDSPLTTFDHFVDHLSTVNDLSGRPQYITDHHAPLPELV
jgi:hypothetical protein